MRKSLAWVWAAAGIALAFGWSSPAAETKAAPVQPAATADVTQDVRPDVAKFKGFLGGELVSSSDTGLVLKVKSVTVVEGSQAKNPCALVGKQISLQFATEKDAAGKAQPAKWLADASRAIQKMPWLGGLGGFAMPNQMVLNLGEGGGAVTATTVVVGGGTVTFGEAGGPQQQMMAPRVHGRVAIGGPDGGNVELLMPENDDEADAGKEAEPAPAKRLPRLLVRAQADEKGTLVMDRLVPGSQTGHEWGAMPKVRVQAPPKAVPPTPPRKETTDF
jgi:hypothetical protein